MAKFLQPQKGFFEKSSIHGLKYLSAQRSTRSGRIFWTFVLLMASFMLSLLIFKTTNKFMAEQIVIKISKRQFSIGEIPFPAVTFCPDLNTSSFDDIMKLQHENRTKHDMELLHIIDLFYDQNFSESANFVKTFNLSILQNLAQPEWFEKIVEAKWKRKFFVTFSRILTKWGFCYNFNMLSSEKLLNLNVVSKDFNYEFFDEKSFVVFSRLNDPTPWRTSASNLDLKVIPIMEPSKYYNKNSFQPYNGIRVLVHNPYELPSEGANQFFHLNTTRSFAYITPELNLLDESVKSMNLEQRNCFLPNEKALKYFKIYTKKNCEQECLSLKINEACGCVPFYMIRAVDDKICNKDQRKCYKSIKETLDVDNKECKCLSACESIKYQIQFYSRTSLSVIWFRFSHGFSKNFFHPLVKHRAFGFSEFLSCTGGLMSLFAGISAISLIELVYRLSFSFFHRGRCLRVKVNPEIVEESPEQKSDRSALHQLRKYISNFLQSSNVHGLAYTTGQDRHRIGKSFWSVVVISSIVTCSYLINNTRNHAELNPVAFEFSENIWNVNDIPFPTITYCPDMDRDKIEKFKDCISLKKKRINCDSFKRTKESLLKVYSAYLICRGLLAARQIMTHTEIFGSKSHNFTGHLEDFTRYDWMYNQSFCYNGKSTLRMSPILTYYGFCFSINAEENLLNRQSVSPNFQLNKSLDVSCNSQQSGSSMKSYDIEVKDVNRKICRSQFGSILIDHIDNFPGDNLFEMEKTFLKSILLKPKIVETDESLRNLKPFRRGCFFSDEGHLRFFDKYSKKNCEMECRSNVTLEVCSCVPYQVIRDSSARICTDEDNRCALQVMKTLYDENSDSLKACNCLPGCNSIEYGSNSFKQRTSTTINSTNNFALFSIYFDQDEYVAFKRSASHGTVSFLSNIGGLLALFLGASILSVVEFFYFLTMRFINNLWLNNVQ